MEINEKTMVSLMIKLHNLTVDVRSKLTEEEYDSFMSISRDLAKMADILKKENNNSNEWFDSLSLEEQKEYVNEIEAERWINYYKENGIIEI